MVGVDGSPDGERALDWAIEQAALERRPLVLAHALQPWGFPTSGSLTGGGEYAGLVADLRHGGQVMLDDARDRVQERRGDLTVVELLSDADPRTLLLGVCENAAMVVVGSRGRGPVASLLLGSVSVSVSKHARCPVVVCRPPGHRTDEPGRGVLVGVDVTGRSRPALEFAHRVASFRDLPLTILHCYFDAGVLAAGRTGVGPPPPEDERLAVAEGLAGLAERYPDVLVEVRLVHGIADQQLVAAAESHELLVVGHHPIAPLTDLVYGSLAPAVVEHAHCAVAVVPTADGRDD